MKTGYDKVIGYSPLDCVEPAKLQRLIALNKVLIDRHTVTQPGDWLLVAGAGNGQEALILERTFGMRTIGVDLNVDNSASALAGPRLSLQRQDLLALAFAERAFGLIYCYHVLEHVRRPWAVLGELNRVLRPGGALFIGFPNKHRLVAYIGTSQRASAMEKLQWNIRDYAFRLTGRFDNEHGAHAGFSQASFLREAHHVFPTVLPVRNEYMILKYPKYRQLLRALILIGAAEFVFPSNYFVCLKGGQQ